MSSPIASEPFPLHTQIVRYDDAVSILISGSLTVHSVEPMNVWHWSGYLAEADEAAAEARFADSTIANLVRHKRLRLVGQYEKSGRIEAGYLVPDFLARSDSDVDGWHWYDEEKDKQLTFSDIAIVWDDFVAAFPWVCEEKKVNPPVASPVVERPMLTATRRGRGGRPPKYDWEEFFAEVAALANTPDGLPEKQAGLERYMAEWCTDNWPEEPAESMIRAKVSRIYKRLKAKAGNSSRPGAPTEAPAEN